MTLNSRGFDWKADLIFDLVSTYDVAFFQENLISDDGQIKSLSARWSGSSFWSPANRAVFVPCFTIVSKANVFHGVRIQVAV